MFGAQVTPTMPVESARRRHALTILVLFVAGAFTGCVATGAVDPELAEAVAGTRAMDWAPGNFWAYRAVFQEEQAVDVALIVHRVDALGFHLGSNSSSGFFGLPFTGNVTPSLNPRIGPDEWPLFRFPLENGKTWSYRMFGYDATTTAQAALVQVPGVGAVPGFTLESRAYGQVFARYDYSPVTGWFTRLELIEPTDGHHVLDVSLLAFGTDYAQAYYIEESIRTVRVPCPATPGAIEVPIPEGYLRVQALLAASAEAGLVDARLEKDDGRVLADARAYIKETVIDRASTSGRTGSWTLHHACGGLGEVFLEVSGLAPSGPLATLPADELPAWSLGGWLQSTRPDRAHTGHVTSIGTPVDV